MPQIVYFLGPKGSFSHQAGLLAFPENAFILQPVNSFFEITQNLLQNDQSLGILPIENSTTSNISENIETLFSKQFFVTGQVFLDIELNLFGLPQAKLSQITEVFSHPKALAQASNFLNQHNYKAVASSSTAKAKEDILNLQNPNFGFIGGSFLESSEVQLLSKNIGNVSPNKTRFAILTSHKNRDKYLADSSKSNFSLVFSIPHAVGSLAKLLTIFSENQINLNKIESKQIPGTIFEYEFLVDLEFPENNLKKLIQILDKHTKTYEIIGRY